eukprot:scpid72094/ scgid22951/ 
MFNPSFYKCDVNEFRRRVVKPVPLQCPHVQPSKTEHQSMSVKPPPPSPPLSPPSCIHIRYICSALLLQNLDKMHSMSQCCISAVALSEESGRFQKSKFSKPISIVHRLCMDTSVMFYAVFRRIFILCDLGYYTESCQLRKFTSSSIGRDEVHNAYSLLYMLCSHDKDWWLVAGDLDNFLLRWVSVMVDTIVKIRSYVEHDIAEYSRILGNCKAMLPADHSSVERYLKHVEEAVRRQAAPFHPQHETTATVSSCSPRAESTSSKCASSYAASADAAAEFCRLFMAERLDLEATSTTLDKEAENVGAEQNECSLASGNSSAPYRERMRSYLSRSQ